MSILKKAISKKADKASDQFTDEELEFLLKMLAECTFSGKDVQAVYNIAVKLQNQLTE